MTAIKQFSVSERFDYENLLQEAIETVRSADAELGADIWKSQEAVEDVVAPLSRLQEAQALLAGALTVQPLRRRDLEARGLALSPDVKQWMKTHRFYLVQVPVTLMPASGWAFTRLECWVGFEVRGDAAPPKNHDIYPENVWTEILNLRTRFNLNLEEGLKVGLDHGLKFQACFDPQAALASQAADASASAGEDVPAMTKVSLSEALSAEAQARLAVAVDAGMQLAVGPFDYGLRRPQVLGVGRENSEVFWRLEGAAHVQKEEPYLAVVLRVPKGDDVVVDAAGELIAYHQFDLLTADVRKDLWGKLRGKVQSFFSKGAPLKKTATWSDITAG